MPVSYLSGGALLSIDDFLHDHLGVGDGNLLSVDQAEQIKQLDFAEGLFDHFLEVEILLGDVAVDVLE
jgi:hypothetical protein